MTKNEYYYTNGFTDALKLSMRAIHDVGNALNENVTTSIMAVNAVLEALNDYSWNEKTETWEENERCIS